MSSSHSQQGRSRAATALVRKADMFFIPYVNSRLNTIDPTKRIEVFEERYGAMLRNEYEAAAKARYIQDMTWDFLMAMKKIRALSFPQSAIAELDKILEEYIKVNSPHQINISDNERADIINAINSGKTTDLINSFYRAIKTVVITNFYDNFYSGDIPANLTNAEKLTILLKDVLYALKKLNTSHKKNSLRAIVGSDANSIGLEEEKIPDAEIRKVFAADLNLINKKLQPLIDNLKKLAKEKTKSVSANSESKETRASSPMMYIDLKKKLIEFFSEKKNKDILNSVNDYIKVIKEHENSISPVNNTLSQYLNYVFQTLQTQIDNLSIHSFENLYNSTEEQEQATRNRSDTAFKEKLEREKLKQLSEQEGTSNQAQTTKHKKNVSSVAKHFQYIPSAPPPSPKNVSTHNAAKKNKKSNAKKTTSETQENPSFFGKIIRAISQKGNDKTIKPVANKNSLYQPVEINNRNNKQINNNDNNNTKATTSTGTKKKG